MDSLISVDRFSINRSIKKIFEIKDFDRQEKWKLERRFLVKSRDWEKTQWREVQLRVFYQHFSIIFDILSSIPERKEIRIIYFLRDFYHFSKRVITRSNLIFQFNFNKKFDDKL